MDKDIIYLVKLMENFIENKMNVVDFAQKFEDYMDSILEDLYKKNLKAYRILEEVKDDIALFDSWEPDKVFESDVYVDQVRLRKTIEMQYLKMKHLGY